MIRTTKNGQFLIEMLEELKACANHPNSRFGRCLVLSKHRIHHRVGEMQISDKAHHLLTDGEKVPTSRLRHKSHDVKILSTKPNFNFQKQKKEQSNESEKLQSKIN